MPTGNFSCRVRDLALGPQRRRVAADPEFELWARQELLSGRRSRTKLRRRGLLKMLGDGIRRNSPIAFLPAWFEAPLLARNNSCLLTFANDRRHPKTMLRRSASGHLRHVAGDVKLVAHLLRLAPPLLQAVAKLHRSAFFAARIRERESRHGDVVDV